MTSATFGVERTRRRRFRLHCACGATVASSGKIAICNDCGRPLVFHRRRRWRWKHTQELQTAGQDLFLILASSLMFVLLLVFLGVGWTIMLTVLVLALAGARRKSAVNRTSCPDYNLRFRYLGWAILLSVALIAFTPILDMDAIREGVAVLNSPQPTDCDWGSSPMGDKHCHYESRVTHVVDQKGEHLMVEWRRVYE